jgi:integrase
MSRRGRGEGAVYRRKSDGKWVGVVDLGWQEGRRQRRYVYGRTRREVVDRLGEAQRQVHAGVRTTSDRFTVAAFLGDWLAAAKPTIRASTFASYESIARIHLEPAIGRIPIARLTIADVERLLRAKESAGLSPRRVQLIRATLRRALRRAVRQRLIVTNVAAESYSPRQTRHPVRVLEAREALAIREAIRGSQYGAALAVLMATGLRSGELRGLAWSEVDLAARTLRVSHTLQRVDGQWQLLEPKTHAGNREVALLDGTVAILREHRKTQLESRMLLGASWVGSPWDLVFTTVTGRPIDASGLLHAYHRCLDAAGLPRRRIHDARHDYASILLDQGESAVAVSQLLGHASTAVTLSVYGHLMNGAGRKAVDRLEGILG